MYDVRIPKGDAQTVTYDCQLHAWSRAMQGKERTAHVVTDCCFNVSHPAAIGSLLIHSDYCITCK
jgi:hypothetical protein